MKKTVLILMALLLCPVLAAAQKPSVHTAENRQPHSMTIQAERKAEEEQPERIRPTGCGRLISARKLPSGAVRLCIRIYHGKGVSTEEQLILPSSFLQYGFLEGDPVWFYADTMTASFPPQYSTLHPVFVMPGSLAGRYSLLDADLRALVRR